MAYVDHASCVFQRSHRIISSSKPYFGAELGYDYQRTANPPKQGELIMEQFVNRCTKPSKAGSSHVFRSLHGFGALFPLDTSRTCAL